MKNYKHYPDKGGKMTGNRWKQEKHINQTKTARINDTIANKKGYKKYMWPYAEEMATKRHDTIL